MIVQNLDLQIKEFFKDLTFIEESHKYYVGGSPIKLSVSGLIKKYDHPTNWEEVAYYSAKKRGMTIEEVKADWQAAADLGCEIGSVAHLFGEHYPLDKTLIPQTGYEQAIKEFWDDLPEHIVPLSLEIKMYHKEYLFAGTADILLYNTKTNKIFIGDYKTNKDLFKNYNQQRMTGPFSHLLDCPFNHYQLQLSFYQILLEQFLKETNSDIEVAGRKLIFVKPDGGYEMYELDDYTEVLRNELKFNNIAA